jgi:TatD DNase family protein
MLIDTHAHLTDTRFDADRPDAVKRAAAAGVSRIIEIACEPASWPKALELAASNQGITCAVGLHPQEAKLWNPGTGEELKRLAAMPLVSAVGETGLDYHYENSPRQKQKEVFELHIELALEAGKPLIIHCREAYEDLLAVLNGARCRGVVHCFSGDARQAEAFLALGLYLGIDGPVTYPKSHELKKAVEAVPSDRILLETDSPYLPPQPHRGQRNEPAYLGLIAEEVARIKGLSREELETAAEKNARLLFNL